MKPARVVLGFLARFLVVIIVLSVAYKWIAPAYEAGFRTAGNFAIPGMGANCKVAFRPLPADSPARDRYHDTKVVLKNTQTRQTRETATGARVMGFVPAAMLIALVLATPVSWRRRGRALGWGLLILHGVILARVAVAVLYLVGNDPTLGAITLSPTGDYIVTSAFNALARSTLSSYVLATLVWIAVCLRTPEWHALTRRDTLPADA